MFYDRFVKCPYSFTMQVIAQPTTEQGLSIQMGPLAHCIVIPLRITKADPATRDLEAGAGLLGMTDGNISGGGERETLRHYRMTHIAKSRVHGRTDAQRVPDKGSGRPQFRRASPEPVPSIDVV